MAQFRCFGAKFACWKQKKLSRKYVDSRYVLMNEKDKKYFSSLKGK